MMTFLLIDNKSANFYYARKSQDEVAEKFHDMKVGEYRPISDELIVDGEFKIPRFEIQRER